MFKLLRRKHFGILLFLALATQGCGNEGGGVVKVGASSSVSRVSASNSQQAAREAQDRAADKRVNGAGPATTIRTGVARSNSMQGSSLQYLASSQNTSTSSSNSSSASKSSDRSAILLVGVAIAGLFGKDIIRGGAKAFETAKDELKSATTGPSHSQKSADKSERAAESKQEPPNEPSRGTQSGALPSNGGKPTADNTGDGAAARSTEVAEVGPTTTKLQNRDKNQQLFSPQNTDAQPSRNSLASKPANETSTATIETCRQRGDAIHTDLDKFWKDIRAKSAELGVKI